MGRILVSASVKSHMNPELRKRNALDCLIPEEIKFICWLDLYELTGIDESTILTVEIAFGWFLSIFF